MIRHIQQELVTRMWEKEIEIVEQYCLKYKSKNKKIKLLYHKIQNIDLEVKARLLSNYMELRRSLHCIIFARWRLNQIKRENSETATNENQKLLVYHGPDTQKPEDEYLNALLKFKTMKAANLKFDMFKGVEPGILDIEIAANEKIEPESKVKAKEKEKENAKLKNKRDLFKKNKAVRGSIVSEVLFNKGTDFYVPLDKIDEGIFVSNETPKFTFLPNRETMHMMIKKATLIKCLYELYCEEDKLDENK